MTQQSRQTRIRFTYSLANGQVASKECEFAFGLTSALRHFFEINPLIPPFDVIQAWRRSAEDQQWQEVQPTLLRRMVQNVYRKQLIVREKQNAYLRQKVGRLEEKLEGLFLSKLSLTPAQLKQVRGIEIEDLPTTNRVKRAIKRIGVETLLELLTKTENEVLEGRMVGEGLLAEIKAMLDSMGYSLKMY